MAPTTYLRAAPSDPRLGGCACHLPPTFTGQSQQSIEQPQGSVASIAQTQATAPMMPMVRSRMSHWQS